jgi:drug/metabolite transporter (DMT)-like permease
VPRPVPAILGTACCLVSALGYTAANVCLRRLADDCDAAWVTCVKASVSVAVVGPWLIGRAMAGRADRPALGTIGGLVALGLIGQFGGNLSLQYAFGTIGLATTVPLVFGFLLIASAVLGRIVLGERVSQRSLGAIGLLIGSVVILGMGANAGTGSIHSAMSSSWVLRGVGVACFSGICYSALSVGIRRVVATNAATTVPGTWVVFVTTATGLVTMGLLSLRRLGIAQILNTRPDDFGFMLAAGAFNLVAYLALAKGLQSVSVVRVNVLNASQVAMCAVAGMLWFSEPPTGLLLLGIGLTIVGISVMDRPRAVVDG